DGAGSETSPDDAHEEQAAAACDGHGNGEKERDLLSQISDMLREQHELALKARRPEQAGGGRDEFRQFVRHLLPFLDNYHHLLEMAREHTPSDELDSWLKSVEALYCRLVNLLEDYGLRFINSVGKVVDLIIHDVVEYRRTDEYP